MHCVRYDVNWNVTDPKQPQTNEKTIACDKGYEYNFTSVPFETIATEVSYD